jgi:hypothetical protein
MCLAGQNRLESSISHVFEKHAVLYPIDPEELQTKSVLQQASLQAFRVPT